MEQSESGIEIKNSYEKFNSQIQLIVFVFSIAKATFWYHIQREFL